MSTIGERLEYARLQRGLTYNQLGDYVGVGGDAIRIAVKRDTVKAYYLNVFAEKLDINKEWLLNGEGDMLNDTPNGLKSVLGYFDKQSKAGASKSSNPINEEFSYKELAIAREEIIALQKEEIARLKKKIEILKKK